MTISRNAVAAALAGLALIGATATGASADTGGAAPAVVPADAQAALERLSDAGRLSDTDRATLRNYPEIARTVVDPQASTTVSRTVPVSAQPRQDPRPCFITTGTHHAKTLLGNTFYKLHHEAHWCTDRTNVIGVHVRRHHFTEESDFAQINPTPGQNDVRPAPPAREVTSTIKYQVQNCAGTGCGGTTYPYVKLVLRGDGVGYPVTGQ